MSLKEGEIDWNNPAAVEEFLSKEGLGQIDGGIKEKVASTIDITKENIEYKKEGNYIYFYFNDKIIGFIQYFAIDEYLQFIGNINGCNGNLEEYAENSLLAGIFQEGPNIEIKGLGKYMLEIFFTEFCIKGQEIKMRIENPRVRSILNGLKNKGYIKGYFDIKGIPNETVVEV